MKLLILTDGIYPFVIGGMQKHSFHLAKFLSLRGHDITLVHCVTGNSVIPPESEVRIAMDLPAGCKLHSIAL